MTETTAPKKTVKMTTTVKKKVDTKARGRPKKVEFMPWEEAREFVRSEQIPSRSKYLLWWDQNQPRNLPHFPYRVYKEWTSWNDFLGTNNEFNKKAGTKWRPILEAMLFVHTLHLRNVDEWLEWTKIEGNLPEDIPARPELVYKDWKSWNQWLGNKPVEVVEVRREAQKLQVYYVTRTKGAPTNVLSFGIEPTLSSMKERWERFKDEVEIVKLFWFDNAKAPLITQILDAFTTPYRGDQKERVATNVWEVLYHLQIHLNTVTPAEASKAS